jgi:hypothetical protein
MPRAFFSGVRNGLEGARCLWRSSYIQRGVASISQRAILSKDFELGENKVRLRNESGIWGTLRL